MTIASWTFGPEDGVPPPVAPFAHATAAGPTLYVTGQMPTDLDGRLVPGGISEQTDQVMRNLARVLELVGGSLSDVVAARAYLTDWADYPAFNVAYQAWFAQRLPSRTCTGTEALAAGACVEVDLVAWRAEGWQA
ncbi:MAG: RidA family protein [Solirubrobacteraceae bacterium MAG38_C4-C5]|nr:RidA family protein [Candidatus Siliceabacter maunaloa]